MDMDRRSYPPGHQPYDAMNAVRMGALVGGVLGIALLAIVGVASAWMIIVFAVVGAVAGYVWHAAVERPESPGETDG